MMTISAEVLSRAVVLWTGKGRSSWPLRDDAAIVATFPSFSADLLAKLRKLEDDFYQSNAWATATNLVEMGRAAKADFRALHPELTEAALDALAWCYTYDYK
jgi:hypothetical protein